MKRCGIVLGPPGSGKGKLAKKLVKTYGFQHISSGDLCRSMQHEPGFEEEARIMAAGAKVNEGTVMRMVENVLPKEDGAMIIVDGVTRSASQAEKFIQLLRRYEYDQVVILDMIVDLGICKQRLIRAAEQDPDRIGRPDNDEEVYDRRLADFQNYGPPTLSVLRRHFSYKPIYAAHEPEEVHKQATTFLVQLFDLEPVSV
jgi:adenylate kinase